MTHPQAPLRRRYSTSGGQNSWWSFRHHRRRRPIVNGFMAAFRGALWLKWCKYLPRILSPTGAEFISSELESRNPIRAMFTWSRNDQDRRTLANHRLFRFPIREIANKSRVTWPHDWAICLCGDLLAALPTQSEYPNTINQH